jgi:hypothetical protein
MSGLYWLATSERERERAMELARALQQRESRDELGIGSVRDSIADVLFPGTSTLHTRARYFLFIPWAYQSAALVRGGSLRDHVRWREAALITALRNTYAHAEGDGLGIIGRDAGATLKRMPSTLYWQGLHAWGIRRRSGPQSAIERALLTHKRAVRDDDGQQLDGTQEGAVWHPNLPQPAEGFPEGASFDLPFGEADFLAERLRTEPATTRSMLAFLTNNGTAHGKIESAWDHPAVAKLPARLREVLEQARRASLLLHGAAWLYNIVLASKAGESELEDEYREAFADWAHAVGSVDAGLAGWDLANLWTACALSGRSVPTPTRLFIGRWQRLIDEHGADALVESAAARRVIIDRERTMKGRNARTANQRALQVWGGASGTGALDYRWRTARRLLDDISNGLGSNAGH